jgi:1A family penicillin-binding protein
MTTDDGHRKEAPENPRARPTDTAPRGDRGAAFLAAATERARRLGAWVQARRWPFSAQTTVIAALGFVLAFGGLYSNCGVDGCPDVRTLTAYQPGGAPVLLDHNGQRFADLAPYERVIVSLDSLPEHVPQAFIAVEDRRFWDHHGVDWVRVFGAALANVKSRGISQGSSTISMQLARNVFPEDLPGRERTPKRKLEEMRVAQKIEHRFSKNEILEMYLNHIYFGGGAYGIEAASRLYFGKAASKLTLAEAATLAALPKAPAHYDPRAHPESSKQRRNVILGLMLEQGFIDAPAAEKARSTEVTVSDEGRLRSAIPLGAYFIDVIRPLLEEHFGERLYRSKLRIYTTLDQTAQRAAEKELEAQVKDLARRVRKGEGELQGAFVMLDAHTGAVMALVGGRDPTTSRYNRVMLGRRQLGSSFKPFVYATAIEEGIPTSRVLVDLPISVQVGPNDVWQPANYDGTYEGQVSMREALVRSRNIPTVRLASEVGIHEIATTATAAGLEADMDETPSLALGTVATSPLELASAYTTFATLGTKAHPWFILKVEDETGKILWEPEIPKPEPGMDHRVAYIVTDMLRDAVDHGTGTSVRGAGFYGPAAGKTGTTNDATDAWFVGYTPEFVASVWVGYDTPQPLGSGATGGGFAAPVWGRVMKQVYAKRPMPLAWQEPPGLVWKRIDAQSGMVLQDGCQTRGGAITTEIFLAESVPSEVCPYRDFWGSLWDRIQGAFGRERQPVYQGPIYPRPIKPRGREPGQ